MAAVPQEVKDYVQAQLAINKQDLLDLIGRAGAFVDRMDDTQKEVVKKIVDHEQRSAAIIVDLNQVKIDVLTV